MMHCVLQRAKQPVLHYKFKKKINKFSLINPMKETSVKTHVDLPFLIAISGVEDCVLGASTVDIGTIIVELLAFRSSTND